MTIKATGAEWRDFIYDDGFWPDWAYHEDEQASINGQPVGEGGIDPDVLRPDDLVTVTGGYWVIDGEYQGTLESLFLQWRRRQSVARVLIEIPRDRVGELESAAKALKGSVVSGK